MEIYTTEEEQIQAIKKWWHENGTAVFIGVIIGIGSLLGWHAWQRYQITQAERSSRLYTQLIADLPNASKTDIDVHVEQLQTGYARTPYAVLASLAGAKAAVERDDIAKAKQHLQWAVEQGKQTEVVHIAELRLARIYIAEQDWDAANALLDAEFPDAYRASVAELQGDILFAQQQFDKAREAYTRAQDAESSTADQQILQTKLDAVASLTVESDLELETQSTEPSAADDNAATESEHTNTTITDA